MPLERWRVASTWGMHGKGGFNVADVVGKSSLLQMD